ncbi:GGDEF domain-containing protein [Vibrio alfacsensis]|uniref:GGDEF domain-containing protein n=1 Tax=Vibrio alfacsensis TaxID=1074311 RepID=UPI00406861E4
MDNFSLDIRTLNFTIILFSCIYSIGLMFYQYNQRKIPGLTCFAISLLFIGAGPMLLSFRDGPSDWITVVASNTIILLGFLLTLYGVSMFRAYSLKIANGLTVALPIASGLTYYFTFHVPSIRMRIIVISVYLSAVTLASATAMMKGENNDHRLPMIGMASSLCAFSMFMLGRVIWSYYGAELTDFMAAGLIHQLTFLFSIFLVVSMSFFMLWLINARLLHSIKELSTQDALTGLSNRRAMENVVPKIVEKAKLQEEALSFIMTDIDNFKYINDACGHLSGDKTIVKVAELMTRYLPRSAQAIRFGGDEFLIILPRHTAAQAAKHAEKLRGRVKAEPCCENSRQSVTMSFGVAQMEEGESVHDVISRSDHALYHSKQQGRDKVTVLSADGEYIKQPFFQQRA